MDVLDVRGLTKHYTDFTLKDITFSLKQGRIMGLIGKNGAERHNFEIHSEFGMSRCRNN